MSTLIMWLMLFSLINYRYISSCCLLGLPLNLKLCSILGGAARNRLWKLGIIWWTELDIKKIKLVGKNSRKSTLIWVNVNAYFPRSAVANVLLQGQLTNGSGFESLESRMLKYSADEYLFRAALCHLCVDRWSQILYIEPEFFNFYGTQKSIPRNQFCQPM